MVASVVGMSRVPTGSSPVVENVGSYHVVVSGIVGGSSLVSRISYGLIYITKKISAFALRPSTAASMCASQTRAVESTATSAMYI